jgi:hypothetical protein
VAAYKFSLVTTDGDIFDSFETSEGNWKTGDIVIAHGNRE